MQNINSFQKGGLFFIFGVFLSLIINFMFLPYIFSDYYKMIKDTKFSIRDLSSKNKVAVPITKGICTLDKGRVVIDTFDPYREMYVDLPRSTNQLGGAQFSYSFWLRRGVGTEDVLKNKIIFYRGVEIQNDASDLQKGYVYQRGSGDQGNYSGDLNLEHKQFQPDNVNDYSGTVEDKAAKLKKDKLRNRVDKCPLIRFGQSSNSLRIEFNSIRNPHLFVDLDSDVFTLIKSSKKNPHYNLITFSIQDNFDFGGIEKGIKVDAFIDDALVKTQSFEKNSLKINNGPIILFASNRDLDSVGIIDADIVDLTYYNYALNTEEIDSIYNKGFKEQVCQLPDSWRSKKHNNNLRKINLYNETKQI
jgi:hypothetical protein